MAFLDIFIVLLVFCLGLVLGSFLNSYIYRLDRPSKSRRSFCDSCSHELAFLDLIPVISFVFLKGKCRYCGRSIPWQYPLVELTTGFLFLAFFLFIGVRPGTFFDFFSLIYYWFLSLLLIIIVVYDIKNFIILDKILLAAIAATFLHLAMKVLWNKDIFLLLNPVFTALLASGFFFFIYFISRGRWMGFGDVKLAFLIGLSLGFPGILPGLFFAFLAGAIMGVGLMVFKNKTLKTQVPFAPFLLTGQLFAVFAGDTVIKYYLKLTGL